MTKGDCLGGRNKLYITLHEVHCLHSENCQMGQEAGSVFSVKNKDQGEEKQKTPDCPGPPSQPGLGWEGPGRVWCLGLAAWACCLSGQVERVRGQGSYPNFVSPTLHPGWEQSHVGPRKLCQQWEGRESKGIAVQYKSLLIPARKLHTVFSEFSEWDFWNWRSFDPPQLALGLLPGTPHLMCSFI